MRKILTAAVALSVLATAGAAYAQPQRYDRQHNQRYDAYDRRDDRRDNRYDRRDDRRDDRYDRRDSRRDDRFERRADRRYNAGRYHAPRGYQHRQWHRGDRLPASYRTSGYVIDHRRYGLATPGYGQQYVRVGNDAVLTTVATGVIAAVILSLFQ